MASSFIKQNLESGGGAVVQNGHGDATVIVAQIETAGNTLNATNERGNTFSVEAAKQAAGNIAGLTLDKIECVPTDAPSRVDWRFSYSNDGYYEIVVPQESTTDGQTGSWDQSSRPFKRAVPAVVKRKIYSLTGLLLPLEIVLYDRVFLSNVKPERVLEWRVKTTTTDDWNANVAGDIAARVGTIHIIDGNAFEFNGTTGVRRRDNADGSSEYEITYSWLIDPGSRRIGISSDQPEPDSQLILPPVIASGDTALDMPGGFQFEADVYSRLPFHEIQHGDPETPGEQPVFLQYQTSTFSPANYNDWTLLPGDPIGTL